jgi:calcineurin-like phosphoesterase family protein
MTSRNIFVISDTHLGHRNMYTFMESDGFPVRKNSDNSVRVMEETDELMVENWNKIVRPNDIVYHLGDVYFGQGHVNLYRLNGRKRLILGNHDNGKDEKLLFVFEKIMVWRTFPEWKLVLSHIPLHDSTLEGKVNFNLHGHIHRKPNVSPKHLNCSVEMMDYSPKSIEDLRKNFNV